jgi:hypothetical protein
LSGWCIAEEISGRSILASENLLLTVWSEREWQSAEKMELEVISLLEGHRASEEAFGAQAAGLLRTYDEEAACHQRPGLELGLSQPV